ncbi:MAG: peptide deformylase [Microbacteriaceae bacterium]|nr:peptide deformylase [Microbacteriaceae bacterium]
MTVRPIRVFGDPVLRTVSDPISLGDLAAVDLVADLLDTVVVPGRAGVAACQIGVSLRAFSVNVDGAVAYIINPVLVEVSGQPELVEEGCLSVPGLQFPRLRYPYASVTGVDLEGEAVILEGSGLMAQALQHELDHLNGHLFIQELDRETKRDAMRQIRESPWF